MHRTRMIYAWEIKQYCVICMRKDKRANGMFIKYMQYYFLKKSNCCQQNIWFFGFDPNYVAYGIKKIRFKAPCCCAQ